MKKRIAILGGGLIGSVIARELSKNDDFSIVVFDRSPNRIEEINRKYKINGLVKDLSQKGIIKKITENFDLIVGAVPGFLGFQIVKEAIQSGKNIVDISFSEKDYSILDNLAKKNNVTAIFDCGIAPGMSNILSYSLAKELDIPESLNIYIGGLPQTRTLPYEYKIVFSPIDVIEEYTRPARVVEGGKLVLKEALSDIEHIEVPLIGTLEAFNTDGLRSLIKTLNIPNMKEKTIRYPGHAEKMRLLRNTGFFSTDYIKINNFKIKPIDFTAQLLFPIWEMKENDKDFTYMKVEAYGIKGKKRKKIGYEMLDFYDNVTKTTSMARTTGYTAVVISQILLENDLFEKGVFPPEYISENPKVFKKLMNGLKEKGVSFRKFEVDIKI